MRDKFISIGKKSYVNIDKVCYIISADADKVRRILKRNNIEKHSDQVIDLTSDKETRSMLILEDRSIGLSNVNAQILAKRANIAIGQSEEEE